MYVVYMFLEFYLEAKKWRKPDKMQLLVDRMFCYKLKYRQNLVVTKS